MNVVWCVCVCVCVCGVVWCGVADVLSDGVLVKYGMPFYCCLAVP